MPVPVVSEQRCRNYTSTRTSEIVETLAQTKHPSSGCEKLLPTTGDLRTELGTQCHLKKVNYVTLFVVVVVVVVVCPPRLMCSACSVFLVLVVLSEPEKC